MAIVRTVDFIITAILRIQDELDRQREFEVWHMDTFGGTEFSGWVDWYMTERRQVTDRLETMAARQQKLIILFAKLCCRLRPR